jgi:hypothetical protein
MNYVPCADASSTDISAVEVQIANARTADLPGWEVCGFELMNAPSAVDDWSDEEAICSTHYPEAVRLAQDLTGCKHAVVSGHILRNPQSAVVHADLAPIQFVHSDFAETYGDRLREFYASDDVHARNALAQAGIHAHDVHDARRLVVLQFWRNVGPATMDLPIAFCDARCIPRDQVAAFPVSDYAGDGFAFDTLGILAPSDDTAHRWYTYPDMTCDEVIAFRTYDSDLLNTDQPFWTPHSAFADPRVAAGQPSRYSIELRATCLFD